MSRMKISGHLMMLPEEAFVHCGDKRIKPEGIETAIAVAALAVAAGGAYMSYESAQQSASAQKNMANQQKAAAEKQFNEQKKLAELENVRSVRAQLRQQRAAQAAIINQGAGAGTIGSSGVAGGVSSVGAQTASNLGFMSDTAGIRSNIGAAQLEYGNAGYQGAISMADAGVYGAIGGAMQSIGGTVFQGAGGFKTVFKG